MKISILSVFPELYHTFLETSLINKARQKGLLEFNTISFFDFAKPKERIDSPSFGPGAGMLIKPDIVQKAIESQEQKFGKSFKIFFSPQGKKLNQKIIESIKQRITENHLMLIASRYEGMDSRVEQYYADEVISIGDFVLMGGDLPAMCFIEALARLIPEVVGKSESVEHESFSGPFVDYPEYTDPVEWKNMKVPDVIRSGNHALIKEWRQEHAAQKTVTNHFEWLRSYPSLNKEQIDLARKFIPNHYAILMHSDVLLKEGQVGTTSVTSLDIHDIARSCATYAIKNYFISTPLQDQQKIVTILLDFWKTGFGAEYNIHRTEAVKKVILTSSLNEAIEEIEKKENQKPILIATSAKKDLNSQAKYITYHDHSKVWALKRPVLFIFGTGHGLSKNVLEICDFILDPINGFSEFNHLSVRSAAAIVLDRWLGINPKID